MNRERNDQNGAERRGPVAPPSLGEVYDIASRRQRNRQRVVQGTLVAVAVAGIGFGVRSQRIDDNSISGRVAATTDVTAVSVDAEESASAPTTVAATSTTVVPTPPTPTTVVTSVEVTECFLEQSPPPESAAWMVEGFDAYFENQVVPVAELERLAAEWQIPFGEVKGLVGLATRNGMTLTDTSIDEAFSGWTASGHELSELSALAEEWETTTISIKVLRLIGGDDIDDSLQACGLS